MENSSGLDKSSSNNGTGNSNNTRVPLSDVVSDCIKRWFKDTLKEAKAGDINMQVLVSQMYYSGYGVPKDEQKVCSFFLKNLFMVWCCFCLWFDELELLGFCVGLLMMNLRVVILCLFVGIVGKNLDDKSIKD